MTQLNNLQAANLGAFEEDPSADDLLTFGQKFNNNMKALDSALDDIQELNQNMNALELRGVVSGYVFGGSY